MSKEAMKLALEALEYTPTLSPAGEELCDAAITSLREALASEAIEQPAQQEPVAKHYVDGGHLVYPPAQRTWVGLTDEEKRQIFERDDYQGWLDYINAIEAKLKEKNT